MTINDVDNKINVLFAGFQGCLDRSEGFSADEASVKISENISELTEYISGNMADGYLKSFLLANLPDDFLYALWDRFHANETKKTERMLYRIGLMKHT